MDFDPIKKRGSRRKRRRNRPSSQQSQPNLTETEEMLQAAEMVLYLCTCQYHESCSVSWVVHSIKMSDLLSESEIEIRPLPLKLVASYTGDLPFRAGCGVFNSKILIGGGLSNGKGSRPFTDIFSLQTNTGDQQLKLDSSFPPLPGRKDSPLLLEKQGQLYALNSDVTHLQFNSSYFEVYNQSSNAWNSLPPAPIWDPESQYNKTPVGIGCVITDTSILISRQETPVFRFDITKPDAGWSEQKSLCSGKSFPFQGTTLVQDCPHGGFIIFAMDIDYSDGEEPPTRFPRIPVYLMSKDYDSLILVETVELPFTNVLPIIFYEPVNYKFLDLGDQRVGLVLAAFNNGDPEDGERMNFLVATFQYRLSDSCSFSYQCLSNPVTLEYSMRQHAPSPVTWFACMLGAFVL